ncbi:MAG: hypothetical protein JW814_07575 [Candidatus Krumholzibacteriota bacterium]|nr:hypothetical protein [Candidatus Krumholzibacteriota bacterium]
MENKSVVKESTVKDFLEVIFRRKWIIVGVVLISTVFVIILNLKEPAVYESVGKMLVKRGEAPGVFNSYVRVLTWEEEIASQIEMVRSQVVLDRANDMLPSFLPDGYETPEKINPGSTVSGVISTSNVLWVTYTCLDPVFAEAAVNAIVNSYKEYYQQVRTPPEMDDFFTSELTRVNEDLEYWRQRKSMLEKEWGIVDIQAQERNTLNRIEAYRTELDLVQKERSEVEDVITTLEKAESNGVYSQAMLAAWNFSFGTRKTMIEQYVEKLQELKLSESELSATYTDEHRELKKVRKQISDINIFLKSEIDLNIEARKTNLSHIIAREKDLKEMIDAIVVEKDSYPEKGVELERIDRAIDRLAINYSDLKNQHMTSKVALASNPEWSITILAPATPGNQKKTRDYVRMALGPIFSLVIALGFTFFIDNLDHSIKNISEAEDLLGFQVLSSFPDMERK